MYPYQAPGYTYPAPPAPPYGQQPTVVLPAPVYGYTHPPVLAPQPASMPTFYQPAPPQYMHAPPQLLAPFTGASAPTPMGDPSATSLIAPRENATFGIQIRSQAPSSAQNGAHSMWQSDGSWGQDPGRNNSPSGRAMEPSSKPNQRLAPPVPLPIPRSHGRQTSTST